MLLQMLFYGLVHTHLIHVIKHWIATEVCEVYCDGLVGCVLAATESLLSTSGEVKMLTLENQPFTLHSLLWRSLAPIWWETIKMHLTSKKKKKKVDPEYLDSRHVITHVCYSRTGGFEQWMLGCYWRWGVLNTLFNRGVRISTGCLTAAECDRWFLLKKGRQLKKETRGAKPSHL